MLKQLIKIRVVDGLSYRENTVSFDRRTGARRALTHTLEHTRYFARRCKKLVCRNLMFISAKRFLCCQMLIISRIFLMIAKRSWGFLMIWDELMRLEKQK